MNTTEEWERAVPERRWGSEKDVGHVNGSPTGLLKPHPLSQSGTIHTGRGVANLSPLRHCCHQDDDWLLGQAEKVPWALSGRKNYPILFFWLD